MKLDMTGANVIPNGLQGISEDIDPAGDKIQKGIYPQVFGGVFYDDRAAASCDQMDEEGGCCVA